MSEERTHESVFKDIQNHPENHVHDYDGLMTCSFIDGILDLMVMDAHSRIKPALGFNGEKQCDVISGPCSCGAWH